MLKLPPNFRFRRNWRGKMILQKQEERHAWCEFDFEPTAYFVWVDAKWEDLVNA
jgi:hypothetical protein